MPVPSSPSSTNFVTADHPLELIVAVALWLIAAAVLIQHGFPFASGTVFDHPDGTVDQLSELNVYVTAVDGLLGADAARL